MPNLKIVVFLLWILIYQNTESQKINEMFSKPGGFKVSLLNQNCSYPCVKISKKMVNFDFVVPMAKECPKLKGSMDMHELDMESPCTQAVSWNQIFNLRDNFKFAPAQQVLYSKI